MYKVLEVEFKPVWDKWVCKIISQDDNVLKRGLFKDIEIGIESITYPSYDCVNDVFLIKGWDKEYDDEVILCSSSDKKQIEDKVDKLNKKYSDITKWYDRVGSCRSYFIVDINDGSINQATEDFMYIDNERYKLGNYFKSVDEAKKFLEDFKEFSLKWRIKNNKK